MNKEVQHPCIGCVYFKVCGQKGRTILCEGRLTNRERKRLTEKRDEKSDVEK